LITVNLTDVNEAPTAVALANATASILENTPTATHIKVADINVTDDTLGNNILGLTGADAASFEIVGTPSTSRLAPSSISRARRAMRLQ
jgi:3-phytase